MSIFAATRNTRPLLPDSWRFLRSDVPTSVSEAERIWLIARNILTVVDLRTAPEQAAKPCPLAADPRFTYLHLPVTGGDALPASPACVSASYLAMADAQMARIIDAIWHAGTNVLYFCNAGKDRTGVVSAILLDRLGYSDEAIVVDYMLSRENLLSALEAFAKSRPDVNLDVITPHESYIRGFLEGFRNMKMTFRP